MNEEPTVKCKNCGSLNTYRYVTGGTGFILKGSGFFKNDYGKHTVIEDVKED